MYLRLRNFEMFEFHFLVLTQGVFLTPFFCSESTPKRNPLEPVAWLLTSSVCLSITQSSVIYIHIPYSQIIIIVFSEVPDLSVIKSLAILIKNTSCFSSIHVGICRNGTWITPWRFRSMFSIHYLSVTLQTTFDYSLTSCQCPTVTEIFGVNS
jgi:hypothetical protein